MITSIEPEDIECVDDKHTLQKLFKYYLTYAKAVSESDKKTLSSILNSIRKEETVTAKRVTDTVPIETEMKERLEERGYKVDTSLGSMNSRISLAIYDQKARKYVLGIELDTDTLPPYLPHLERDIYKRDFLEAHGWRIMRVWCRDWWHNPVKVIDSIERAVKQPEKTV